MAGGFGQYLRDTRTELRHVAWPTRLQTIVYAVLVAGISIGIALYLGLFDFLFTSGLSRLITTLPQNTQNIPAHTASSSGISVTKIATGTAPVNTK